MPSSRWCAAAGLCRLFVRQLQVIGSTYGTVQEFDELLRFVARTGLRR
ncbi:hypothetical protein KGA65_05070 [Ideonella sp. B7]|nr:hypothetical protein [Ideonella benzenivorans]MCA6215914.1 hypothetical protein [Ideonella benzenivorans]